MSLAAGTRLGAYEIVALLGAGGMGEVYRARDTRLKREVAIKVLPDAFASDPDRLARFQREAELLATLNHPNIGSVYGFEQSDPSTISGQAVSAIILELIEGETLADRIHRGPIAVKAALAIALQIAEALEAAHERGVIHRDLKPANIKITPDDKVKVLDFGLARALSPVHGTGSVRLQADLTHSPTLSMMGTQAGMILGTAAYMSPEQAKGFPADQRSDVFAFGTVLYEMLTGRQPFSGDTAPDVLASVIVRDADLNALPRNLNPRLKELIERCLEKNPKKRWQAVGDVRAEVEKIAAAPHSTSVAAAIPHQSLWRRAVPIVMAAILFAVVGAGAMWHYRPKPAPLRPIRFVVPLPQGQQLANAVRRVLDVSPDGSHLLFVANQTLFVRELSQFAARPISGIDPVQGGIFHPIFSPDGQSIAFYSGTDQAIKRVAISGGAPVTVSKIDAPIYGMSWSGNEIFYGQGGGGIMRVDARSGKPERVASVQSGEFAFGPQILPGGQGVLFSLSKGVSLDRWDRGTIVVQSLGSGERRTVIEGGSDGRYVPVTDTTGYLLYAQAGVLFAVPFDLPRLEATTLATPVLEGVKRSSTNVQATTHMAVSHTGTLVYIPGPLSSLARGLGMLDRTGSVESFKVPSGPYLAPRISPDGTQIVFGTDDGQDAAISIYDVSGKSSMRRLTFGARTRFPVWSRDGQHIVFQSDRDGTQGIFRQRADGSGTAERLTNPPSGVAHAPDVWLPLDDAFLFSESKGSQTSLWIFSMKLRTAVPFGNLHSGQPITPIVSPDGKWLAYTSTETGLNQVFMQPVPITGARYQISRNGGHHPLWSPDGRELVYDVTAGLSEIVNLTFQPTLTVGKPKVWPRGSMLFSGGTSPRPVDMSPDGRMVGAIAIGDTDDMQNAPPIHVVVNWFEELKQLAPVRD
jgi:serine/threonine protein kinase/Tol biopolymer transport system component